MARTNDTSTSYQPSPIEDWTGVRGDGRDGLRMAEEAPVPEASAPETPISEVPGPEGIEEMPPADDRPGRGGEAAHPTATETPDCVPESGVPDDCALMESYLGGDQSAFSRIVQRYRTPIHRIALRWVQDTDEADELTQRTFLRLLSHAGEFKGCQLKSYLFRIAVNLCKNHLRDRAKLVFGVTVDADVSPDLARLEEQDERAVLRRLIGRLPPRQRQVVLLRIDGDLPFADVARALDITENSAKVNFHHALTRLKQLKDEEDASLAERQDGKS